MESRQFQMAHCAIMKIVLCVCMRLKMPMVSHGAVNIIASYFLGILSCRNVTKSI